MLFVARDYAQKYPRILKGCNDGLWQFLAPWPLDGWSNMPWPIHTMPPYIHWRRSELCQGPMERGTCRSGPTKCWWSDKKTTLPGDIYIYTHTYICACIICMWYYIYICVCVCLNPFEPNKQTYIKLHKLGQNHSWDKTMAGTRTGLGPLLGPLG